MSVIRGSKHEVKVDPFERVDQQKREFETTSRERRAIRMVRDFMSRSEAYRDPHLELARRSREMYENWKSSGRSIIQRANLRLPYGYTVVETQLPQLTDIFLKDEQIITVKGQDAQDAVWEDPITDFFTKQLDQMNFASKFIFFCKGVLLDGTGFAKVPYRFNERPVIRREQVVDPLTGEASMQKREILEILYDGPDFDPIPIFDFFPDWSVKAPGDIDAMRGCVHRTYHTFSALKASGFYNNLDEVEQSLNTKGPDAWGPPWFSEDKDEFEGLEDNVKDAKDGAKIEIWEYWGLWDPKGDGNFEEYIITLANGDVVIREEPNFYDYKFKPFVACPNVIRDKEFYGIPELAAIRALLKEANSIRNARLDNINLAVNPMMIVDRAAGINSKSLFSRPGGIVWANDINGIAPMKLQDPSIGSREELGQIQQDIQNATALIASTPSLGQLGKTFGRSATGVEFISNIANSRIGLKARLLSEIFFKRLAWIMMMTNRQFVTEDTPIVLSDPNLQNPYVTLPPDAFFHRFDFMIRTDLETGGPEAQFQRMQAVSQVLQAAEQSQPGTVKFDVVLEQLLRPLLGNTVKRFTRTEEERQALQNQQLAAQQAINAQTGREAPQPNSALAALGLPTTGQ